MEFISDVKDITDKEKQGYIDFVKERTGDEFKKVSRIIVSGEKPDGSVKVSWFVDGPMKFERTRRITGYLVGTIDRWNNAKKAELADRVKHI